MGARRQSDGRSTTERVRQRRDPLPDRGHPRSHLAVADGAAYIFENIVNINVLSGPREALEFA